MLSDDLLPFCSANDGPELEGLQNLLLSVRRGHHAITGPYEIFSTLARNANLAQRERAIALGLANRRTELPLLEKDVKHKVLVTANVCQKISRQPNKLYWQINICNLNTKFMNPLVVLGENMLDAELYQQAGRHYKISNRFNSLTVRSSPRGGGGSQIDVELNSLLSEGVPVLVITDGDFTFPGTPTSVISNRCATLIAEERGIGWHFTLPVREIENIIPRSILLTVADPKIARDAHDSVEVLSEAADGNGSCPSGFTCLKKGRTLAQVFASENIAERDYWMNVAKAIRHKRPRSFSICIDESSCSSTPCTCSINDGFGEDVLAQVKKWVSERSSHESLKIFSSSEIWMRVGAMVFETGVAFKAVNI